MRRWFPVIAVLLIAGGALAFRLPRLAMRPLHNDEAVNTLKFKEVWETGAFAYDPHEYHGPTLYYVTAPFVWMSGARSFADSSETPYRMVPLAFGVGLILLTLALRREIGALGVVVAALYAAASPAMTFYSRYYIHETLLVFFTFAAMVCGWRFFVSRKTLWAVAAGGCMGLMWATKETWIIPMAAAFGAIVLTWAWIRLRPAKSAEAPAIEPQLAPPADKSVWGGLIKPLTLCALAALVVAAVFFTSFFSRPRGLLDAVLAYKVYFSRGAGNSDHVWPFAWYLKLLTWYQAPVPATWKINRNPVFSEAAIVALAAVGFVIALVRRKAADASLPFARFLAFYTLLLTLAYSVLPYKTPWCALGFLHGMTLLAGFAVAQLVRVTPTVPGKVLAALIVVLPSADLVRQSYQMNYGLHATRAQGLIPGPWVYAHTIGTFPQLPARIRELTPFAGEGEETRINVVGTDYWPLPFYLRRYTNVGYWGTSPPDPADAPFIVSTREMEERLKPLLRADYHEEPYKLRDGVWLTLRVRRDVWDRFIETRK
jgi:uncharacterized protein (TIGR03663 family)